MGNELVLAFGIVSVVLSIAAVVLAYIFITPDNKRAGLNKFGKMLHDTLNFKYLVVEKILQGVYIFFTAYCIIFGFLNLFNFQSNGWGGTVWYGGQGLAIMIFGPILVRLSFELMMMFVLLVKNVISINNKLKNQNGDAEGSDVFSQSVFDEFKTPQQPVVPQPPQAVRTCYCQQCGAVVQAGVPCPHCGTITQ